MSLKPPVAPNLPLPTGTVLSLVDDFGARSGEDVTSAITQAFDELQDAGGGTLYVPRGQFITTGNIVPNNVTIWGAGQGSTILKLKDNAPTTSFGGYTHPVILGLDTGTEGVTLMGLEFDGNVANNHSVEQTHCVEAFGVTDFTMAYCTARDVRGEMLCIGKGSGSSVEPGNITLHGLRLYNTGVREAGWSGADRQGISITAGRIGTISDIQGWEVRGFLVDLETNNASDSIEGFTISNLSLYDGKGILGLIGYGTDKIKDCHASNLVGRDGATYALTYGAYLAYCSRCSVDGLSLDQYAFTNTVRVENSNDVTLDRIISRGASFGGTESAVYIQNSNRTLVTGSSLRNAVGSQRYAVEENGTCTYTTVRANQELAGSLGRVLLSGAGSVSHGNGEDPHCLVTRSAGAGNQSINSGADTAIQFDEDTSDVHGMHDTVTNNTRVTIKEPGWYEATGCVRWAAGAGALRRIGFVLNGTTSLGYSDSGAVTFHSATIPRRKYVTGDYIEMQVRQDTGGALNVVRDSPYSPSLSVVKVA